MTSIRANYTHTVDNDEHHGPVVMCVDMDYDADDCLMDITAVVDEAGEHTGLTVGQELDETDLKGLISAFNLYALTDKAERELRDLRDLRGQG